MGYRQDYFKYVIHDPFNPGLPGLLVPLLTEKDKSVRSVSIETYFKLLIMELFQLRFDADYAWPQSGKVDLLLNLLTGVGTDIAVFPFNTNIKNGSLYDIIGSGGFSFNVLPSSIDQKLLIVPQGGYSYHYQKLRKKGVGESSQVVPGLGLIIAQPNLQEATVTLQWWGPFVGADVSTDPRKQWFFEMGYFYHFLNFKRAQPTRLAIDLPILPATLVTPISSTARVRDAYAHRARARMTYEPIQYFVLGLSGNFMYFSARKNKAFDITATDILTTPFGTTTTDQSRTQFLDSHNYFWSILLDVIFRY